MKSTSLIKWARSSRESGSRAALFHYFNIVGQMNNNFANRERVQEGRSGGQV